MCIASERSLIKTSDPKVFIDLDLKQEGLRVDINDKKDYDDDLIIKIKVSFDKEVKE